MYTDICCYDKFTTREEVRSCLFSAVEHHLNGISVYPCYLSYLKEFIPSGFILSACIDYPHGISIQSVRNHAVQSSINRGANAIDLVANHVFLVNKDYKKFELDIQSAYNICRDKNASLRVMLEYRVYLSLSLLKDACNIIKNCGIEYIFVSTGSFVDDFKDHLLVSYLMEKHYSLNVICNTSLLTDKQYESVKKSEIFGVRFNSIMSMKNAFGVL